MHATGMVTRNGLGFICQRKHGTAVLSLGRYQTRADSLRNRAAWKYTGGREEGSGLVFCSLTLVDGAISKN